jgi:hypothetical protein
MKERCIDRRITTQWSGRHQDSGALQRLSAAAHFSRWATFSYR